MKLCKSTNETPEIIFMAFSDEVLNQTMVFQWHLHFKAGRYSFEDNHNSG